MVEEEGGGGEVVGAGVGGGEAGGEWSVVVVEEAEEGEMRMDLAEAADRRGVRGSSEGEEEGGVRAGVGRLPEAKKCAATTEMHNSDMRDARSIRKKKKILKRMLGKNGSDFITSPLRIQKMNPNRSFHTANSNFKTCNLGQIACVVQTLNTESNQ